MKFGLEYAFALLFVLLSILSLWSKKFITKLLLKFFSRDDKLTKVEKLFIRLSVWVSYFFALLFFNLAVVQLPLP
ncbi:MAG: mechanosensitive ion channel family protein, partial [Desulfurobacterium sp.]